MTNLIKLSISLLLLCVSAISLANNTPALQYQDIRLIENAVKSFAHNNTASHSGQVVVDITPIDSRITLPACVTLTPFLPSGAKLWGKTSIGVRCEDQTAWTIYVQAEIKIFSEVIYVAQPVARGQTLGPEDITPQKVNLTQVPEGVFTDPAQVIGKIAKNNLSAGQPVRQQMLRDPYVILRGQKVQLVVKGQGFSVTSEGQALADASDGQIVQIRNPSGRIISGIARENAIVEVRP